MQPNAIETIENDDIPQRYQNQFWRMLQYVKNGADFESEVRLAWNLQTL